MPGADTGALAWDDLAEGRKIAAQGVGILVVDFTDVHLAEVARANDFFCVAVIELHRG